MKATEVLMEEHDVILRVLIAMEEAVEAAPGGQVRPDFFLDAADFIKGFADGCHHAKEEGVLFPSMETSGVPARGGPIGVMLADHENARMFTRSMRDAAQQWQAGDVAAKARVLSNAAAYINLLRAHIHKENTILFPMADRAVPAEKQAAIWQDFERVEHEETGEGVHEKYLALAAKLEQEAAGFVAS